MISPVEQYKIRTEKNMKLKIAAVLALFTSLIPALSYGQGIVNLASGPPPAVPSVGINQTGATGSTTYYYQIVTRYAGGAVLNAPTQLLISNGTLSMSNYNTISWGANSNALSYDVLRFTTNTGYTGTCTCLVGNATSTTINDQSNTVTSYTLPSGAVSATAQVYINTRDHVSPQIRYAQGNADQPLGNTVGGSRVTPYTSGAGGTTQHTLVKISAGTVITLATTDTAPGVEIGIAKDTTIATQSVDVATEGTSFCVVDASGVTAGNIVVVSTTTAGDCADSGQTALNSVTSNLAVIGRALTTATSGNVTNVALFGPAGRSVSVTSQDCGNTATCAATSKSGLLKVVTGIGTLVTGSPSTFALTAIAPAFTSAASFTCTAQDATTVANNIGVLTAGYVSGSAVTFTGPNTNTDVFRYVCTGW